jgi:hypothetical protein
MSAENRSRGCGNVLPSGTLNGLCPVFVFRQGLVDGGSAVDTGPFMSGTHDTASALASLEKSLGGLPRVLLRDSAVGSGLGPLVQPGSPEMPAARARTGRLQLLRKPLTSDPAGDRVLVKGQTRASARRSGHEMADFLCTC